MRLIRNGKSGQLISLSAAVMVMAALAWPSVGRAEGALVVGKPDNVVEDGIAFGYANDKATADEAIRRAMEECHSAPSSKAAQARCTLVRSYHNECVAIAMDPKAGTPGAGWAVEKTLYEAQRTAMDNCNTTAGPDRQGKCEPSASHCDGTAGN